MDKFEIGEIAIINYVWDKDHGKECEIIELGPVRCNDGDFAEYRIRVPGSISPYGNEIWEIDGKHLRKRRPPTELSTWEEVEADMGWNPTKQSVAICNEGE